MKKILILSVLVLVALFVFLFNKKEKVIYAPSTVSSFEKCVLFGYPIMESYPRQCADNDGNKFIEDIGNILDKSDLIRLISLTPDQIISSPLLLEGEARGSWYFEGSFPVELVDSLGNKIPLLPPYITADGEWMTTDFVPFSDSVEFTAPVTNTGELLLIKSNASGLPEHDDLLRIPVRFR